MNAGIFLKCCSTAAHFLPLSLILTLPSFSAFASSAHEPFSYIDAGKSSVVRALIEVKAPVDGLGERLKVRALSPRRRPENLPMLRTEEWEGNLSDVGSASILGLRIVDAERVIHWLVSCAAHNNSMRRRHSDQVITQLREIGGLLHHGMGWSEVDFSNVARGPGLGRRAARAAREGGLVKSCAVAVKQRRSFHRAALCWVAETAAPGG